MWACFFPDLKTPEKRSHNGYTNLPDVVQPSHSPTDSASHSSPGKDSVYDVSLTDAKYIRPEFLLYFCVISVGHHFSHSVARKIRTQSGAARISLSTSNVVTANEISPLLQFQSRGLVKASGKSSFTTFVDLGMYQSPGGTGDNISVSSESTYRPPSLVDSCAHFLIRMR